MKKIITVFLFLIFTVLPLSICANAVNLSDGTYEVPVILMHKEGEKESFGNKYVAQTALLTVEGDKKTIAILLTTDMSGIEFSYYTNGSLEGNVAKGKPVSNITVAGKTYKQGFEIPIMSNGDIGLKFSVPAMPMSPSARLRIDYSKAVLITSNETATVTLQAETTTLPASTESTTQDSTTELTTQAPATSEPITEMITTDYFESTTVQEKTTIYVNEITGSETNEEKNETISSIFLVLVSSIIITYIVPILIIVILFIIGIVVIKRIIKSKRKEENKNDDK